VGGGQASGGELGESSVTSGRRAGLFASPFGLFLQVSKLAIGVPMRLEQQGEPIASCQSPLSAHGTPAMALAGRCDAKGV
jgi:hypothetical protein